MKIKDLFLITFSLCIYLHKSFAQETADFVPEKIKISDFDIRGNASDSGADAIILYDIGNRIFEKNELGDYDILFKRITRIKIINKRGLDAGQFVLRLNTLVLERSILIKLPEEGLVSLDGTTYNRENGVIHEVKLDRASVISQTEGKKLGDDKICHAGAERRFHF